MTTPPQNEFEQQGVPATSGIPPHSTVSWLRPRVVVLTLLWVLPGIVYVGLGLLALYQTGWLGVVAATVPVVWLLAWAVSRWWQPSRLDAAAALGKPLLPGKFWTEQDTAAIAIVEKFRAEIPQIDQVSVADPMRYMADARELAARLAQHYQQASDSEHALHSLTLIEIFAVIHLAAEDVENWMLENLPGGDVATIGQLRQLPRAAKWLDVGQSAAFLATAVTNPAKLLAYPLWRKAGGVVVELRNELVRALYQRYLRQIGFYLIETYSGRLRGGSRQYRSRFGSMSAAVHAAGGKAESLQDLAGANTTIAVMGQVKAGKSSLINALLGAPCAAATGVLPETRQVQRFDYALPGSDLQVTLLDTPGYDEADVSRRQRQEIELAVEQADAVVLVLAAHTSARQSDLVLLKHLCEHYRQHANLKAPPVIAVLTHIDLLRPLRAWQPPYDWRHPKSAKEQSIAAAVTYAQEIFGEQVAGYACVYTGDDHADHTQVADEVVPLLLQQLDQAHAAAVLKAFYKQLSQQRLERLTRSLGNLAQVLSRAVIEG